MSCFVRSHETAWSRACSPKGPPPGEGHRCQQVMARENQRRPLPAERLHVPPELAQLGAEAGLPPVLRSASRSRT